MTINNNYKKINLFLLATKISSNEDNNALIFSPFKSSSKYVCA